MNSIIRSYGSDSCYCRPDTTWERENKDFYSPDCVKELHWSPILFVRISKAGKYIGKKFASRYYEGFNFGVLLYCMTEGPDTEIAYASCADHTSLLPSSQLDKVLLESGEYNFDVKRNEEVIFSISGTPLIETIEDTICKASQLTSLRIGDYVAVELKQLTKFSGREDSKANLSTNSCGNDMLNIEVIF